MHKYKKYLIVVLMVTLALNTKDRLIFGLALQDIKLDLALSDTQLGLLTGIAFALFYAVAGIPMARWADQGNRVSLIAISTAVWSIGVGLCGLASNFIQLFLIRIGVAVGEAGCTPPAHSLIADYFSRAERAKAIAFFQLGTPLSALIGYFLGGWLIEFHGWRTAFFLLGFPGIALAILSWLTLKEPRRVFRTRSLGREGVVRTLDAAAGHDAQSHAKPSPNSPSVRETFSTLWRIPSYRHLLLGFSVISFFSNGAAQWKPTFFMRTYGMTSGEIGTWFTIIYGGLGLLGTYLGGALASRYAANNERLQLRVAWLAYSSFGLLSLGIYMSPNPYVAIALTGFAALGIYAVSGPLFATIQSLAPVRMRAMSVAVVLFAVGLIGAGLGPLSVGMLSDLFQPWAGDDSLRFALVALCPGYVWSGWHFFCASKTVAHDLSAAEGQLAAIGATHPSARSSSLPPPGSHRGGTI